MTAQQSHRPGAVRRIARWSVNLVLLLVVAAGALWLAPTAFGYERYVITGGSMSGSIEKGSVVFEKPVAVADLAIGDVITYLPPAASGVPNLVTHRIVGIEPAAGGGTLFTTKGDANLDPDPWKFELVDAEQAVVQFSVPHVGWLFVALADRQVRMILIGGPAALIALIALGQLVGAARRRPEADTETATEPALVPATTPGAITGQRIPAQRVPAHQVEDRPAADTPVPAGTSSAS